MSDFKITIPEHISEILNTLEKNGHDAYIVGGCVRDIFMQKIPSDFDITTSASPEETIECFKDKKLVLTGLKHGTVAVVTNKELVEITTFRTDGDYKDNRHPQNVTFVKDIKSDLSRRDFTINAIAYSPKHGLVDPFNGFEDIKNKIIRCVGDANTRFDEDALRIMRGIRFSGVLSFVIEEETKNAIHEKKELLKNISVERIRVELEKLLVGENVFEVLMNYSDIIFEIIPELEISLHARQNCKHHIYTVWEHTCHTVKNIEPDIILRLTMLLHDNAKPIVKQTDKNGNDHFVSHPKIGSEIAEVILKRLKFDNKTVEEVKKLILHHDDRLYEEPENMPFYIHKFGYDFLRKLDKISRADILSQNPKFFYSLNYCDDFLQKLDECEEKHICTEISDLKIDGNDLIKLGFSGRKIGEILEKLLFKVMNNEIENEREVLIKTASDFSK